MAVALACNEDIVKLDLTDNGMGSMGAKYIAQVRSCSMHRQGIEQVKSFGGELTIGSDRQEL